MTDWLQEHIRAIHDSVEGVQERERAIRTDISSLRQTVDDTTETVATMQRDMRHGFTAIRQELTPLRELMSCIAGWRRRSRDLMYVASGLGLLLASLPELRDAVTSRVSAAVLTLIGGG